MAQQDSVEAFGKAAFWYQMQNIYTTIPCIVVEVIKDLKEQRVSIQPCIDILSTDGSVEHRSVIVNVPLIFPASSTSALTFPVSVGDTVAGLFSMRAMEIFSEGDGMPAPPNNFAKFHQKDAMAIPGLFPRRNAVNNPNKRTLPHSTLDTVIVHNIGTSNEVELRLKPNGDVIINSPSMVQVNCQTAEINAEQSASVTTPELTIDATTTTWNGDITLSGDLNQSGTHTLDGINMNNHTHMFLENNNTSTPHPTEGPQ